MGDNHDGLKLVTISNSRKPNFLLLYVILTRNYLNKNVHWN